MTGGTAERWAVEGPDIVIPDAPTGQRAIALMRICPRWEDRAHLIAAAPDLYEALDKLLTLTKFELGINKSREPWVRNIQRCDAALAKAKA